MTDAKAKAAHEVTTDALCRYVEDRRHALTETNPLPPADVVRAAISGMVNKHGRFYAKPQTFRKAPLASVTHRLMAWHGSGGNLTGVMMAEMDARHIGGIHAHADSALVAEIPVRDLFWMLDTLALVLRNGESPAVKAWRRALYGA